MTVLEPVVRFLMDYRGKTVTLAAVIAGADRPRTPVLRVMDRLVREGCLEEIADPGEDRWLPRFGPVRRNPVWRVVKPPVPRNPKSPKRRTVRDRLWKLIRMRRRFTRIELRRLSGATLGSVEDFTQKLERHGYLKVTGKDGRQKVYLLVKDTGPQRPMLPEVHDD